MLAYRFHPGEPKLFKEEMDRPKARGHCLSKLREIPNGTDA